MGRREVGLFFALFFCLHMISASLLNNNSSPGHLKKVKSMSKEVPAHGARDFAGDGNDKYKIFNSSKFSHGGGHGGGSTGSSGDGYNGVSQPRAGQGGASVIPIYGAAAANKNHQAKGHRGVGSCNPIPLGFSVIAAVFALVTILER